MTSVVICPGCGEDLIATISKDGDKIWRCPECGFSDTPVVAEALTIGYMQEIAAEAGA